MDRSTSARVGSDHARLDRVPARLHFKSAPTYIKELNRYLVYHEMQEIVTEESMLANLKTYFSDNFDPDKTGPKEKRAAPTMRSALSVLKKFWRYSQRGDLKQLAPLIADKLNTWEKENTTCKAPIYTKKDLGKSLVPIIICLHN
jgi:hypothetical protein